MDRTNDTYFRTKIDERNVDKKRKHFCMKGVIKRIHLKNKLIIAFHLEGLRNKIINTSTYPLIKLSIKSVRNRSCCSDYCESRNFVT